jgi:hypothetical protein
MYAGDVFCCHSISEIEGCCFGGSNLKKERNENNVEETRKMGEAKTAISSNGSPWPNMEEICVKLGALFRITRIAPFKIDI